MALLLRYVEFAGELGERQHIVYAEHTICYRQSVCHTWISQKRL